MSSWPDATEPKAKMSKAAEDSIGDCFIDHILSLRPESGQLPILHRQVSFRFPKKGFVVTMSVGETRDSPKIVAIFTASAPCKLPTKAGLKIGSPEGEVRKIYAAHFDKETPANPESFVVGSIFGGFYSLPAPCS